MVTLFCLRKKKVKKTDHMCQDIKGPDKALMSMSHSLSAVNDRHNLRAISVG